MNLSALQYASPEMIDYKQVVLAAVRKNGFVLKLSSSIQQDDKEIEK